MRVTVLGGCGYIGSVLVPNLLAAGHEVTVIDAQWFGNFLEPHAKLEVVKDDIRYHALDRGNAQAVIHLANVANDPAGDLDPKLTWEVNALAMAHMAVRAVYGGAKQFIYASSGSVYGVSDAPYVTEETPLVPLTEYNKTKMVAERVLLSYAESMAVQIIRPGTCCGVSPRQRLDITVNGMTAEAIAGKVRIINGNQVRPNVHIQDLTDVFMFLLERPQLTGIWNAGFENLTGNEIADIIEDQFDHDLPRVHLGSADRRSYRMDSTKLLAAGFKPTHTVRGAVSELIAANVKEEDSAFNLRSMKRSAIA
jgi:nucleoside-diphosphate-sugar epimerase